MEEERRKEQGEGEKEITVGWNEEWRSAVASGRAVWLGRGGEKKGRPQGKERGG